MCVKRPFFPTDINVNCERNLTDRFLSHLMSIQNDLLVSDINNIFSITDPSMALEIFSQSFNVQLTDMPLSKNIESKTDTVLGFPHNSQM